MVGGHGAGADRGEIIRDHRTRAASVLSDVSSEAPRVSSMSSRSVHPVCATASMATRSVWVVSSWKGTVANTVFKSVDLGLVDLDGQVLGVLLRLRVHQ